MARTAAKATPPNETAFSAAPALDCWTTPEEVLLPDGEPVEAPVPEGTTMAVVPLTPGRGADGATGAGGVAVPEGTTGTAGVETANWLDT